MAFSSDNFSNKKTDSKVGETQNELSGWALSGLQKQESTEFIWQCKERER